MSTAEHIFCTCQLGAEGALKREVASRSPELRFAYSRPGFVTFKLPAPTELEGWDTPRFVFARVSGASLGRVAGSEPLASLAQQVWRVEGVEQLVKEHGPLLTHVWQRDAAHPGEEGFEPGITPLAEEVRQAISAACPWENPEKDRRPSSKDRGQFALDVVLVEPNEWWIGCHALKARVDRWPGGAPPLELPDHAVSRAYLKMREALLWSRAPADRGDEWIELGCAPGGASQALIEAGMYVIGVDPADVDPAVAEHPRFCHLRMRAAEARRKEFIDARWLAADINAAPGYTLDAVESIVTHPGSSIRGLLLTLKLPEWELASPENLAEYFERLRGWGYRDVRARQLAFNRREFCVAALRSRAQRRIKRRRRPARGGTPRPRRPE